MSWAPQEAGLLQVCNLLGELQKGVNQTQILQQLDQYRHYPDFNNYLAYVFARAEQVPLEIRQSAGLLLKNNLKQQYATITSEELRQFIKDALLAVLPSPHRALRRAAGTTISVVAATGGIQAWPELVAALLQALQSTEPNSLDGALDTLLQVVEDSPVQMDVSIPSAGGKSASALLVPPLLTLLKAQDAGVRKQAAACLNLMARDMPGGLVDSLDKYLEGLFALAHDSSNAVRREVCVGLVQLLTLQPDRLQPFLYQVIEYMLQSNEVDDEGVALESCEFWMAFCEARLEPELLRPFLPRLIPVLMKNMVFEEFDEEVQEAEAAEAAAAQGGAAQQDKDSELRPQHHKQRTHGAEGGAGEGDDDDDDDEAISRWNLRKCSAAGLDRLSVVYGDELLPVLMPIVEQRLQAEDWRARESAILALGAVSEGCHAGLLPYLGAMVGMLLPKLADPRPMVRIITCWALSRYSFWLLAGAQEAAAAAKQGAAAAAPAHGLTLGPVVEGLLRCVADRNRFVQAAACSGVATLCETAGQEDAFHTMDAYLKPLTEVLSGAVASYGRRNLRLACDAISTLAEAAGPRLGAPELVGLFMPALCARLEALGPQERESIPLMEALTAASASLGRQLDSYAPRIFEAAIRVSRAHAAVRAAAAAGQPAPFEYDRDLYVAGLDMVSGLAEGLGPSMEPLVGPSGLPQMVLSACTDDAADVKQYGFALVGDLARGCMVHLTPLAEQLVAAQVAALAPNMLTQENMKACNNAAWSLGELSIRLPPQAVQSYAATAAEPMAHILAAGQRFPPSLRENAAIALGRLAMMAPDALAPHWGHFCTPWCTALRHIRDEVEKEHAFKGLVALLQRAPQVVMVPGQPFHSLCSAVVSWRNFRNTGLRAEIGQVMKGLQQSMAASGAWQQAMAGLGADTQTKLAQMYEIS